jgi:hypothetical protein
MSIRPCSVFRCGLTVECSNILENRKLAMKYSRRDIYFSYFTIPLAEKMQGLQSPVQLLISWLGCGATPFVMPILGQDRVQMD